MKSKFQEHCVTNKQVWRPKKHLFITKYSKLTNTASEQNSHHPKQESTKTYDC